MDDGRQTLEKSLKAGKLSAVVISLDALGASGSMQPADLEERVVCLEYVDDSGGKSDRWVTVHSVENGYPAKLQCYCWVRKGPRTFRADRVASVSDMDGEVLSGTEFFATFGINTQAKARRLPGLSLGRRRLDESGELPQQKEDIVQPGNMGCLTAGLTLLVGLISLFISLSIAIPVLVVAGVLLYVTFWR